MQSCVIVVSCTADTMEEEDTLYTGSTWYITHHPLQDHQDIIEFDFLKLSVQHIIENRKIVLGTLLITPTQFIFDLDSPDPLDRLEPELFQVVLPSALLADVKIVLNNSKYNNNQIYKGAWPLSAELTIDIL